MDEVESDLRNFGLDFFNGQRARRHSAGQVGEIGVYEVRQVVYHLLITGRCNWKYEKNG